MPLLIEKSKISNIENIEEDKIIITLTNMGNISEYKCFLTDSLEKYIKIYANDNQLNYRYIFSLYNGNAFYGDQLKKQISEIISPQDKNDKRMVLLLYKKEIDFIGENEFIIILSIESVKIVEIYGKKEEKIKDIIIENSIKLDFNWCKFKYKEKEIDLEQKFDNIADDDDKKKLKIEITVNYIIPLIVNLINEQNNKYKIQCLLGDKISSKIEPNF